MQTKTQDRWTPMPRKRGRAGFTLVEVLISSLLVAIVLTAAMAVFSAAGNATQAGSSQVMFNSMARSAQHKISRYIEDGRTISMENNYLAITRADLRVARICFEDADDNPGTVENNRLVYFPDISANTGGVTLCTHVSPVSGSPMFRIIPSSPISAQLTFHVGESTNATERSAGRGFGYQGVEVRMSSTPRNRQLFYQ